MTTTNKLPEQLTRYILVNTETGEWFQQRFYDRVGDAKSSYYHNSPTIAQEDYKKNNRRKVQYDEQSLWKIQKATYSLDYTEDV